MIAFDFSQEQEMVLDSARRFARASLRPKGRQAEAQGALPEGLAEQFAELGLGQLEMGEAHGGLEQGMVMASAVAEVLAEGDAGLSMALPQAGPLARLVALCETPAAQSGRLAPFTEAPATTWGAVALSGSTVKARLSGDGFVLAGTVPFVWHAPTAHSTAVLAQLDEGAGLAGAALFAVPRQASGAVVGPRHRLVGLGAVPGAAVTLHDVVLPAAARVGRDDLTASLDAFFAQEAIMSAARGLGVGRAAYAHAHAYAEGRQAFGKTVAHFQAIAFLLADMLTQLDAAQLCVRHAAWAWDTQAPEAIALSHAARAQADEAVFFATDNAVQILGGHGYIQDHPVEKWMRDARALALTMGNRAASDCRAAASLLHDDAIADVLPTGVAHPVWT